LRGTNLQKVSWISELDALQCIPVSHTSKIYHATTIDRFCALLSWSSLLILGCCTSDKDYNIYNKLHERPSFLLWTYQQLKSLQQLLINPPPDPILQKDESNTLLSHNLRPLEEGFKTNFETVSLSLNHTSNGSKYLPANSPTPIVYESDIFEGKVLFLIRPYSSEQDPLYYSRFSRENGDRSQLQLELQIQGRFKKKPSGKIFMGIELAEDSSVCFGQMSYLTQGIYTFMLSLLARVVKGGMHYSFGSENERPHIVGPILNNLDRCITTKCEKSLPELGNEDFDAYRSETELEWNDRDIYTFTFRSTFLDLVEWRIVNLPTWIAGKSGSLDLARLWGTNAKLRIVAYEEGCEAKINNAGQNEHRKDNLNYLFCAEVSSLLDRNRTPFRNQM